MFRQWIDIPNLGQYLRVFGGVDVGNDNFLNSTKADIALGNDKQVQPIIGFRYLLPFLIDAEVKVNTNGNVRFQLAGEQRLTRRLGLSAKAQWLVNNYGRLYLDLDYVLTKNIGLFVNCDTRYDSFGGGLSAKF